MSLTLPHVMQRTDMQEEDNGSLAPLIVVGDTVPTLSTLLAKCKSNVTACDSSDITPARYGDLPSKTVSGEVLHPTRMHS